MKKAYSMIGLAKKAGRVASGEKNCKKTAASGECFFVIIAEDASANTRKSIANSCNFYDVPYAVCGSMEELGRSIGNEFNAAVAILDENFAKLVESALVGNINGGGSDGTTKNS